MKLTRLISTSTLLMFLVLPNQGCVPTFIAATEKITEFFEEIDQSLKKQTRKIFNEKETKDSFSYQDSDGLLLEMNSFLVTPSQVKHGEEIHVTIEYSLLGAGENGVLISDKKTLWHDNQEIAVLCDEQIKRNNGTWESSMTFMVPASAQAGKHKIKQVIAKDSNMIQSVGFFTIIN